MHGFAVANIAAFAGLLLNLPESWRHLQTFSRWHRRVKQPDRASAFRKEYVRVPFRVQLAVDQRFPLFDHKSTELESSEQIKKLPERDKTELLERLGEVDFDDAWD